MTATDEVYISGLLATRHPPLYVDLRAKLDAVGITLREIPGTRDIWCRDYMPVPVGQGRFVQFRVRAGLPC